MANDNKKKSLIKDIAIVLCLWAPLLFIIIGGIIWIDDGFDGTLMEQLFPAIFFGFIAAYSVLLILSNLFQGVPKVWYIGAIVVFITTIVCWMLELKTVLLYGAIIIVWFLFLLCLIRWIADLKRKKEVSRYHIYSSDVKLDKDVPFENSCPIAEQSNYTYDSTYNPFAEKNASSSAKQKYCSRCGCLIDNETKKCTGCGKQYLKNIWMTVIVFSILAVLIGSVVLISTRDYRENDNLGGYSTDANFQSSSQPDYKILGLTYDQYKLASIVATYDVNEYCNHIADLKNMVEMSTYREELKKEKVIEYINNNNTLDYGEKIILYRILFSADNEYNSDIVDYLNGRDDVTYDEMVFVLEELGFAVFEDGKVKWQKVTVGTEMDI